MSIKKTVACAAFIIFMFSCVAQEEIKVCDKVPNMSAIATCTEFINAMCPKVIECTKADKTVMPECIKSGMGLCAMNTLFREDNITLKFYESCLPAVRAQSCESLEEMFPLECELLFTNDNPDII